MLEGIGQIDWDVWIARSPLLGSTAGAHLPGSEDVVGNASFINQVTRVLAAETRTGPKPYGFARPKLPFPGDDPNLRAVRRTIFAGRSLLSL